MKKVFVNGCFDIVHVGHIRLLNFAKSQGECLFVALDADERVRQLKGNGRPVNTLNDRVEIIENLKSVDFVLSFETSYSLEMLVKRIKPDVIVVGSDWKGKEIVGSKYAKEVVYFDRIEGYSTTQLISK